LGIYGRPYCDVDPYHIIRLLRGGGSAKEIGRQLGVSTSTVRRRVALFGSDEDIALMRMGRRSLPSRTPVRPPVLRAEHAIGIADARANAEAAVGRIVRIGPDP
jgi:hypothetical protein